MESQGSSDDVLDVVIVGSGLSGLSAAYELWKQEENNLSFIVLEAKDRVGGRTLSGFVDASPKKDKWDLGGQWVGRTQVHVMKLLQELKIETFPQYVKGKKFERLDFNKIHEYSTELPMVTPLVSLDIVQLMYKIEAEQAKMNAADAYNTSDAETYDSMTLEAYLQEKCYTNTAAEAVRAAARVVFGAEASQLCMLYVLWYARAAGGMEALVGTAENTAQEYRVKGGTQQISIKLREMIGEDRVVFNSAVRSIAQTQEHAIVTTEKGRRLKCRKVILAIPPAQTATIQFEPELPVVKRELLRHMTPGVLVKYIVTYKTAFWRDRGYSGEILTSGGDSTESDCTTGPAGVVYDACSHTGSPALVGFIGAHQAVQWLSKTMEQRRKAVLHTLSQFIGTEASECIEYKEFDWTSEPYIHTAPVFSVSTGAMRYHAAGIREPFQRIHFAGTEAATVWSGYMDGAVQAGKRAAFEVLYDLKPNSVTKETLAEYGSYAHRKLTAPRGTSMFGRVTSAVTGKLGLVALLVLVGATIYYKLFNE